MEAIRNALLPRRLTQMYADTKRSYEHIIQTNCSVINPRLSSLFLKLRIQKDRLFAWGLEWRDSGAASQSGDIDGSLDRAGCSDLVASIMSSISQLLDEAERMRPRHPRDFAGTFPDDKIMQSPGREVPWTAQDITRLAEIVDDITTSIDTLCDLSRSQRQLSHKTDSQNAHQSPLAKGPAVGSEKQYQTQLSPEKSMYRVSPFTSFPESSPLVASTRIHLHQLRFPDNQAKPDALPPSYESVAAGAEDRIFAYFTASATVGNFIRPSTEESWEELVLLDYGAIQDINLAHRDPISISRFGALMNTLRYAPEGAGSGYSVPLGWLEDSKRSRYAFVYQIPIPSINRFFGSPEMATPHTLLSFLQHSADTDSSNMPSLEDRFRLAFNLASTIFHLHSKGLTHRNINSNNIFFFVHNMSSKSDGTKLWKMGAIRHPCLTSFDQCDEDSIAPNQEPLISSIYRHPRIERGQRTRYRPGYDIYSLGLILLEIGLWMPISSLWKTKYARLDFKLRLQTIYIKKLAAKCGSAYMRVVDYCLRAADEKTQSHGMARQDPTGIHQSSLLHMEFHKKTIRKLEHCCSIEDLDDQDARCDRGEAVGESESLKVQVVSKAAEIEQQAPVPPRELTSQASSIPEVNEEGNEDIRTLGQVKPKLKIWSHELPIPCAKHWYATMLPELERILRKIIDKWESYSIDLLMVGETPDSARPTIYMMCSSVEKARKALRYVNREKRLFDIKVVKGEITRSKAGKKKRREKKNNKRESKKNSYESNETLQELNPCYQQKPTCGASIGAYMNHQHLPPVSFGGTVLLDGEPFGMSVHHMIENDDDIDLALDDTVDLHYSMANGEETELSDTNREGIADCSRWHPNRPEALYPFEVSEDEEEEEDRSLSDDDDDSWLFDIPQLEHGFDGLSDGEDDINMGDTLGVEPGQGENLIVTQPAIDDVDCSFFANEEDMDDDHLSSHNFGYIHASSGLKRAIREGVSHEVDWALIKVKENRLHGTNIVAGGARHRELKYLTNNIDPHSSLDPLTDVSTSCPYEVVKADDLGGLRVHALGRTSGLQSGTILPTMAMIKMPGRISSSRSWQVMGNFGVGGDSGAWVIDNASGRVCAHVLAWSARNNTAYIGPMEILLDDMAHVLGVDVKLPGPQREAPISTSTDMPRESSMPELVKLPVQGSAVVEPDSIPPSPCASLSQLQGVKSSQRVQSHKPRRRSPESPPPKHDSDTDSDSHHLVSSQSQNQNQNQNQNSYPTPSPSPPMATSPLPCHLLIDNILVQEQESRSSSSSINANVNAKGHISSPSSETEIPDHGVGLGRGQGRGKGRGMQDIVGMRGGGSRVKSRG